MKILPRDPRVVMVVVFGRSGRPSTALEAVHAKFMPLLPPGCDVGWCDRASLGGGSPIGRRARYSDGGREARIDGDVGSYVKYANAAVYGD